jgi:hypothetical protein
MRRSPPLVGCSSRSIGSPHLHLANGLSSGICDLQQHRAFINDRLHATVNPPSEFHRVLWVRILVDADAGFVVGISALVGFVITHVRFSDCDVGPAMPAE